jgi:hypothetical protein
MKRFLPALACIALISHSAVACETLRVKPVTAEDTARVSELLADVVNHHSRFAEFTKASFENGGKSLRIWFNFDNTMFRRFWTNEVAVQYLYDTCVRSITASVFDSKDKRLMPLETVTLVIDIRLTTFLPSLNGKSAAQRGIYPRSKNRRKVSTKPARSWLAERSLSSIRCWLRTSSEHEAFTHRGDRGISWEITLYGEIVVTTGRQPPSPPSLRHV